MHALGKHLLVELRDCDPEILKSLDNVKNAMVSAAKRAKATIIDVSFHEFSPFGISGMVVIAESHLSIHTWPEYGYAAVDIFTCGDIIKPEVAAQFLIEKFRCKNPSIVEIKRGILSHSGEKLPYKVNSPELTLVAPMLRGQDCIAHKLFRPLRAIGELLKEGFSCLKKHRLRNL